MKRCPKCNRTFPDENQKFCTVDGGLLIAAQPAFDPNATIRATSAELGMRQEDAFSEKTTSRELPAANETRAASAPTEMFPRSTAPTGIRTSADIPVDIAPPVAPTASPATQTMAAPAAAATPPVAAKKKSKLPLILGILGVLLVLGVGGVAAAFLLVVKPWLAEQARREIVQTSPTPAEETNSNLATPNSNSVVETPTEPETEAFVPPPGTVKFENSRDRLDGKLAEHYVDFSFYYPESWQPDPKAGVPGASNFAKVERRLPPDFTQENFAVGWYTSQGSFEADRAAFPQLVEKLSESLSSGFPEYRKVSEGPTKVNSMDGYEFRFTGLSKGTEKGDLKIWGRVVFLPSGIAGQNDGATLVMLSTSLAPELSGVEDVGEKGEMPVILNSFRFGKQ